MKIYLISQWFPPEHAPIGYIIRDLARMLGKNGWQVVVITGFPNHPAGIVFEGYRKQWFQKENEDGFELWRVNLATSPNRSKLNRILTFLTFTLSACWALLTRGGRGGVVYSVLQPLSLGLVLPWVARLKGAKLVFNIQDLHPDVPIELGLIRNPVFIKFLRWVERFAYRTADGLIVLCQSFKDHTISKGAAPKNVQIIENWIDLDEIRPSDRINAFRRELNIEDGQTVILIAGTLGLASGADTLLEVARLLNSQPEFVFLFVGEGPLAQTIKDTAKRDDLKQVVLVPFQPRERLNEVQSVSDISIVPMLKGRGRTSVPSKVLGYMAAARPVIASVDANSETARLIKQADCGEVVPPESPETLAAAIRDLAETPSRRLQWGENGRKYLEQHCNQPGVLKRYLDFFQRFAK